MSVIERGPAPPRLRHRLPRGTALSVRTGLEKRTVKNRWARNPTGWTRARLGEFLWSKQTEIANSVVRHRRTAVRSAHDTGKSRVASRIVTWWLDVHPPGTAFAVTTAPTAPQVETILWREIANAHRVGQLSGRITGGSIPKWKTEHGEIIAYGRKPADLKSEEAASAAFQGIHARYILVVLDEACGIPPWLWNAVETLATNEFARVLAIGNPDNPQTPFEKCFRPGSGWNKIKISAFDTPAWTGEEVPGGLLYDLISQSWVQSRAKDWGPNSPLYTSKVLAEFPDVTEDTLLSPSLIALGQALDLSYNAIDKPGRFGLDVARFGDSETACYRNRGGMIRQEFVHERRDTMYTAGRAGAAINETYGHSPMMVDVVGVGGGVLDRLKEQNFPVQPFMANEAPKDPKRFADRRSEMWWKFRMGLENGEIDLPPDGEDDKLIAQLGSLRFEYTNKGKIRIESKEDMIERGFPSPDRGDAAMMSLVEADELWIPPPTPTKSITGDLMEEGKW
jgi:hypothetical protein